MAQIAVVEDNDAMRAQLCGFIAQYAQESGHQLDVTAFSDGAQLVEPYRPGFDIIFLDIEMPTLGGMPTAERIRRQDLMWCSCSSPTWHSMPSGATR